MAIESPLAALPSVDRLLRQRDTEPLIAVHGRRAVTEAIRTVLAELRATRVLAVESEILGRVRDFLHEEARPSLRPVFNLTGTLLHTNHGRAPLPAEAIAAMSAVAASPANLEYELAEGRRGERDAHVEGLLCRLTG